MYLQPMLLPTVALVRLSQTHRHWSCGDGCGEIQFYSIGRAGPGPSQPRFTRSASINHHKLGVLITVGNRDVVLVWGDGRPREGRPHTNSTLLLFSVCPHCVGLSHGNNKSIFVFDEDVSSDKSTISVVIMYTFPFLMKTWSCPS